MNALLIKERGACGCAEHRSGERLREIIAEKDLLIEELKKMVEELLARLEAL